jgi:hypothetical protein
MPAATRGRAIDVRVAGEERTRPVVFEGKPIDVRL